MDRFFFNILVQDVATSKAFYVDLLGMHLHFDSDWFVILKPNVGSAIEFGIIDRTNSIVPNSVTVSPGGSYPTFVVQDCDAIYAQAVELGIEVLEQPTDMFYGQKRMLVRDPDGLTIDISSPTAEVSG